MIRKIHGIDEETICLRVGKGEGKHTHLIHYRCGRIHHDMHHIKQALIEYVSYRSSSASHPHH